MANPSNKSFDNFTARKRAFHCILSVSKSHLVFPMASQNNGTIFILLLIFQP